MEQHSKIDVPARWLINHSARECVNASVEISKRLGICNMGHCVVQHQAMCELIGHGAGGDFSLLEEVLRVGYFYFHLFCIILFLRYLCKT